MTVERVPSSQEWTHGTPMLHNMSAPPRMQISVAPLKAKKPRSGRAAPASSAPVGLQLIARIELKALILKDMPLVHAEREYFDCARCRSARFGVILREALGLRRASIRTLKKYSIEKMEDELRTNLARIEPIGDRFPAFAMVYKKPLGATPQLEPETDPVLALSLLSRVAGSVYVARRSPRLTFLLAGPGEFWFYGVPTGPGETEAP